MSSDNVPLITRTNVPPAVQFGASKDFHTRTQQHELDSAFLGNERRPWIKVKSRRDPRREREAIAALLSNTSQDSSNREQVERLFEENIGFRDLASLTHKDLELFGFASNKERNDLLNMFAKMPNQDPSYEYICNSVDARGYNNQIISNAANHIMYLRSSMAATNYKLKVMPPEDMIIGDKRYASRFALEALNSVQSISQELTNELHKLESLAAIYRTKNQKKRALPAKEKNRKNLYVAAIVLGTACAWFWWWSKRSHNPNLEQIPVRI